MATQIAPVLGYNSDAVIEFLAQRRNLFGVLGQRFLLPAVGNRAQQRNQGRRRGEDDPPAEFNQARVGFQRGRKKHFTGQEQDDELGRGLKLLPIGFAVEHLQMVTHMSRVGDEMGTARVLIGRFQRGKICRQRRLGVHDNIASSRQLHHHIRAQPALFRRDVLLFHKITVIDHACHFDHALQLQLTPSSARLRCAQRLHQIGRLLAQRTLRVQHRLHLGGERLVSANAGLLHFAHALLEFFQALLDRLHQVDYRLLAFFEIAAGTLLKRLEMGFREVKE